MATNSVNSNNTGSQAGKSNVTLQPVRRVSLPQASLMPVLEGGQIAGPQANKMQNLVKRKSTGTAGEPVVTKVYIQQQPNSSQRQIIPAASSIQGQQIIMTSLPQVLGNSTSHGTHVVLGGQHTGAVTPTKTFTLSNVTKTVGVSPQKITMATPVTPTKQVISRTNKIPLSPLKSPTKITMIPVPNSKSPQKLVSLPSQVIVVKSETMTTTTMATISSRVNTTTVAMSPSKIIMQRPAGSHGLASKTPSLISQLTNNSGGVKQVIMPAGSSNVQQMQMSGSKFPYVRLVTTPASQNQSISTNRLPVQGKPIAPAPTAPSSSVGPNIRIVPVNQQHQLNQKPAVPPTQRLLLPATSNIRSGAAQSQPSSTSAGSLTNLPPGTAIIQSGQGVQGVQGFALVPAQYMNQLQQQITPQNAAQPQHSQLKPLESSYIPTPTNTQSVPHHKQSSSSGSNEAGSHRPRKPCNCTKSQCLKLYCDCFANGEFCQNCNCQNCSNNLEHEDERSRAIKSCLDRNPQAFHPKIGKGKGGDARRHNKGCNCKRSGCLKNYCECYEAKILCSNMCKCIGCKNFQESPERKTLMHLADAAEVRVQQQTAAKTKLSSQIQDLPSRPPQQATGERLPYTFVTSDVAEATCSCLLAQAEEAERTRQIDIVQERMILEECGRCLMQIIEAANGTKKAGLS